MTYSHIHCWITLCQEKDYLIAYCDGSIVGEKGLEPCPMLKIITNKAVSFIVPNPLTKITISEEVKND